MEKILLTGCSGQLGRALQAEYGDEAEFILTDVMEPEDIKGVVPLDISDKDQVESIIDKNNPDVIINCAAITNVDGCEADYDTAYRVNAIGPKNLAEAAAKTGAKLIHISTDYVFPGTDPNPISEDKKPDPISAYGRSKLAGEEFVSASCDKNFILRTAWLYGEGKNFVKTMLRLSETHDEISVVDDQIGSPTSASELAKVIKRLERTDKYGLYHATCEGYVSWAGFAKRIFELAKKDTKVNAISSAEYKRMNPDSADRPAYSILDNARLRAEGIEPMADWEAAIAEYLS